jgi:hypothetical protein
LEREQLLNEVLQLRAEIDEGSVEFEVERNLGGGAVAKAYDIVVELVGGSGGENIAAIWSVTAGFYMADLPAVDDKPGNYLSCGFNDYVFHAYQLHILNQAVGFAFPHFGNAFKAMGAYLAYTNFLVLMIRTIDDVASGVAPAQPAGGRCF